MKTYNSLFPILVTLLILASQLACPTLAYADDEPPATPTETVTEPPPPVSDSPEVDPTPETEVPAEGPSLTETLAELPAETDVIVLNENGQPLPLVTQEAAEVIAESDPMWCPANVTTITTDCVNAATVAALLPLLAAVDQNGTIYFTGTYTINDATFDGTNTDIDQLVNNSLTIQGGWDGSTTLGSTITYSGNSTFSVPLSIINWNGTVTINTITIDGATGTGLTVTTTGNINLKDVTSTNNSQDGAHLQNFTGTGNVAVNGTNTFSNNMWDGLFIESSGEITVNDITASGNGNSGTVLDNTYGTGNVTINGTNGFNDNGLYGLVIGSKGDITLNNITASNNEASGTDLYNRGGTGNVTINGTNTFSNNKWNGLSITSKGDITINDITTNDNEMDGIRIISDGNITLNNIITENNRLSGITLFTPGNATLNSTSTNQNTLIGLDASAVCGVLKLNGFSGSYLHPTAGVHSFWDPYAEQNVTMYCTPKVYVDGVLIYGGELPLADQYEFELSCDTQSSYPRTLTNGDKVEIICPVKGKAFLKRLENTMLPASLPRGYTYISAFSLDIQQNDLLIPYIPEGGKVKASFKVPAAEPGTIFSVLYWDMKTQTWVPLKNFVLDENDKARVLPLYPDDPRLIESGLNFVREQGVLYAEFSTNFPGTFVLVQQ